MSGTLAPIPGPAWVNVSTSSGALIPADWWPIICPVLGLLIGIVAGLYLAGIIFSGWGRSP